MDKTQAIQQRLRELFESQNLGVLATHSSGQPYASLVAFYATEDLKHLFFVTPKTTRKFENLKADHIPEATALIETGDKITVDGYLGIVTIGTGEI